MTSDTPDPFAHINAAARKPDGALLKCAVKALLDSLAGRPRAERREGLRRASLAALEHYRRFGIPVSARRAQRLACCALALSDPTDDMLDRARVQDAYANTLYLRASQRLDPNGLASAKAAFEKALALIDAKAHPDEWCTVANSLASIAATRHRTDGARAHRIEADDLYRRIRRVAAQSRLPAAWATAAENMLRMERDDACARGDLPAMERVLRRMRRLLRFRRARLPETDLAASRHLIARTLAEIADRRYARVLLDEAIALWQDNLAEAAVGWATYTNSIGVAEMTIGEKENDFDAFRRAETTFESCAEFPSRSSRGTDRRVATAKVGTWTREAQGENYLYALNNLAQVRESLAESDGSTARLYDNLTDLGDVEGAVTDRSMAATLDYLRARSAMALWRLTRSIEHRKAGERLALASADLFAKIEAPAWETLPLTLVAQFLLEAASAPSALDDFARAEDYAERAVRVLAGGEGTDPYVIARRLSLEARLAAASWRNDVAAARAIVAEIVAILHDQEPTPTQRSLLRLAELDALSIVARIEGRKEGFAALVAALDSFAPDTTGPRRGIDVRLGIARGHALKALGSLDEAIDAWTSAQTILWDEIIGTGSINAAALAEAGLGQTGRVLGAGRGLSLADELATALVARGRPGDAAHALAAIEQGRAILPYLRRASTPEELQIRNALRKLERRLEDHHGVKPTTGRKAQGPGTLARTRDRLHGRLQRLSKADRVLDLDGIAAALPDDAAVAVIALGEKDAALILLDKAKDAAAHVTATLLPGLDRPAVERLLASPDAASGLLPAIEAMQGIGEGSSVATYCAAADRIDAAIDAAAVLLVPTMLDPLDRLLSAQIRRVCWLLPGVMWPIPIHALSQPGTEPRLTQNYTRTLREIAANRVSPSATEPRMLIVDVLGAERTDLLPFHIEAYGDVTRLPVGRRRLRRDDVLRALRDADVFLFNGHGCHVPNDPDRSGLRLGKANGLLSTRAIRGLDSRSRDLAILCACDVGSIELSFRADEFSGMAGELLDAGFTAVIAATWPVDIHTTQELVRRFLDAYPVCGGDAAAALMMAQGEVRHGERAILSPATMLTGGEDAYDQPPADDQMRFPKSPYWWAGLRTIGY